MKITAFNTFKYNTNKTSFSKKEKVETISLQQTAPVFKQEKNISFGAKKISIKAIKKLIEALNKENINFELLQTGKSATIVEFKDSKTIAKTTSFFADDIKKIINYKPDGSAPHTAYQYKKETLEKILVFDINGWKRQRNTFYPNGQRKSITTYHGFASLPKTKKVYYENGKTLKSEITYQVNCKYPKTIKEYNKNGNLSKELVFNEEGKIITSAFYNQEGKLIAFNDLSSQ